MGVHHPAARRATHLLGGVGLVHAMSQLEFVGFAAVQRGEAGDEMDQFARGRRGRAGGLQFIPPSQGRRAWRRHGRHDVGGTRRGVRHVSLARGGRQGAVAGFHGRAEPRVTLHGQAVHVGVGGRVGRAGAAVVLPALGLGFGALREVRPAPLPRFRLVPGAVLLPRLRRGPLDGPILLGEAAACDRAHTQGHAARQKPHGVPPPYPGTASSSPPPPSPSKCHQEAASSPS